MCNLYSNTKNQKAIRDLFKIGAALAFLIIGSTPAALADDLTGQASIIDGDTLEIHGARIRLWGIDAPESSQFCRGEDSLPYRCGAKAANDLDAFIARRPVNCLPITLDQYRRTVASCSVEGVDLGQWLVRTALLWIGRSIQRVNTMPLSAMLSIQGEGCGQAATSSRGYIERAFERTVARPTVRMTRLLILESGAAFQRIVSCFTMVMCLLRYASVGCDDLE
jgi:endonuclease YncB( thermonuclease family)